MDRVSHRNFNISPSPHLHLHISSDFDSGNLDSATLLSSLDDLELPIPIIKLELAPAAEPFNPQFSTKPSIKSYFHFSVKSSMAVHLRVSIRRMAILSIIQDSFQEYYRICVGVKKVGQQLPSYTKYRPQEMKLSKRGDQHFLEFSYELPANEKTYFAYHFPYSYEKLCHFLQDLDEHFKHSQYHNDNAGSLLGVRGVGVGESNDIYFRNELLIQSLEGRQVNLLTITQMPSAFKKTGCSSLHREPRISKSLFPYFEIDQRPFKFNKPYIMITSRVHPGETSASFAIQGFIQKILGSSAEAEFLRKSFVFLIVPLINPDGVFHGTYRMDMQGHNLNRFYNSCVAHKQPAIFAISSLLQHHSDDLVAFFDIHSHPQAKGSFVYGNAYTSIQDQTESQLFAKLLSINSESFHYQNCTFSQKNMNSKDINDILTKDGSSRVCAFKKMLSANLCNGVHCYAIELGYHGCPIKKDINKVGQLFQFKSSYRREQKHFEIFDYEELGTDLINTICQVYIQTLSQFPLENEGATLADQKRCPLQSLREEIAKQIYEKDERFRIIDSGVLKKTKCIHSLICNNLYSKIIKKYPFILQNVRQFQSKRIKFQAKQTTIIKTEIERESKVIHSMELGRRQAVDETRKTTSNDVFENDPKKVKQKLPPRDIRNIFKGKEKMSIVPLQFHIPSQRNMNEGRNVRKRINFNRILEMQADSLPRIERKKMNFFTERQRHKQKRVESSINSKNAKTPTQNFCLPISRGGLERKMFRLSVNQKNTIDSNIEGMAQEETKVNLDPQIDDEQFQKSFLVVEQYNTNYNPEINSRMNMVRNSSMFKRQNFSRDNVQKKMEINNFSGKLNARLETYEQKKRSSSREKIAVDAENQNSGGKALPKLQSLTQKVRNKFDLELKMKQMYDKQYKLDEQLLKTEGRDKSERK